MACHLIVWNVKFYECRESNHRLISPIYQLEDHQLESVTNIDLGITISEKFSLELHIEKMCAKANKILSLVKSVCGCDIIDIKIRKLLYISLVRPILEYVSNIWSPYAVKHGRLIENVQRRATKFILNYPSRDITYKSRLESLDMLVSSGI